jgi:hypothetical protein
VLVLGSSHVRETGPLLQENLDTKFDVSILKPNAALVRVVEDQGRHDKRPYQTISYCDSRRATKQPG